MTDTSHNMGADTAIKPTAGKGLLFLGVLAVVGVIITMFVIANRSPEGPKVVTESPEPIAVQTQIAELQDAFTVTEKFTGLITPRRTSQLGFISGGRVERLRVDVGDAVRAGQNLASLDTRALRAQLASAVAVVEEAEAGHALALVTVDRQRMLRDKGHVSDQVVDEATAQANTAMARIAAAQANTDALKVQIDLAQITAPYAGTITQRQVDEGAIAAPGQPVFELVETEVLEARIGLTAELSAMLEVDETFTLITDQGPVEARLRAVTGVIDRAERTVTSVFDILDPTAAASGAVVRLSLPQSVPARGVWLPVSALTESERGLWSIYIAERDAGDWFARPSLVEIVHQTGESVYVRGAVDDGDTIIIDGVQRITPGQPVTPQKSAALQSADLSGE